MSTGRIAVEGWRLFPHSYAIVNQWQILALLRRGLAVDFHDLPYQGAKPPVVPGIFAPEHEAQLRSLPDAVPDASYDLCYRISYPLNLSAHALSGAKTKRVMVFGTAEHQILSEDYLAATPEIGRLNADENFFAVTPSKWSAKGFLRLGLAPQRVKVVPHGVDAMTFNSDRSQREAIRKRLGLRGFTLIHCGAMTRNKGVDLLLRAFRMLVDKYPDMRLLLKGTDALYGSKELVSSYLKELDYYGQQRVAERVVYIGQMLSMAAVTDLYRAADLYVSPYRAEGFNLPVLEAAACGTPILCTSGGPTDEFVSDDFSRKIASAFKESNVGNWLEPDIDHLIALIEEAITDDGFRLASLVQGPSFVAREHIWEKVVEKLLDIGRLSP